MRGPFSISAAALLTSLKGRALKREEQLASVTVDFFGAELVFPDWETVPLNGKSKKKRVLPAHIARPSFVIGKTASGDIILNGEREVNFYGEKIIFPVWTAQAEREIRQRCDRSVGSNDDKAARARQMILNYLNNYDPDKIIWPDARQALVAQSRHGERTARAMGIICER